MGDMSRPAVFTRAGRGVRARSFASRPVVIALAIAGIFTGCGGRGGADESSRVTPSDPAGGAVESTGQDTTDPSAAVTTAPTVAPGPTHSFTIEDNQGYTTQIDITNMTMTTDVTNAPPGQTVVNMEFDFEIHNMTEGRNLLVTGMTFYLAVDAPTCGPGGAPPGMLSGRYCTAPIALVPPGGNMTLGPGETARGHADSTTDRNWNGGRFMVTVDESLPLTSIYFGTDLLDCEGSCWKSPQGGPVPADL